MDAVKTIDPDTELFAICASQPGTPEASRAFGELVKRHHEYVLRRLAALVGRGDAPEDVAQQIYVELMENASSFDPEQWAFKQWLNGLIKQRGIDAWRKGKKRPYLFSEARTPSPDCGDAKAVEYHERFLTLAAEAVDKGVGPETEACRKELIERFWAYYNTRSPETQSILRLIYVQGMSQVAAARELGIHRDTLARQIGRMRAPLAAALGGSLEDMNFGLERRSKPRTARRVNVA